MTKSIIAATLAFLALGLAACGSPADIMRPASEFWLAPMAYDDTGATTRLAVATVCLAVDPVAANNQAKMISFVNRITSEHPGVRLILFGETSLGYYYRPADPQCYQESLAETIPGPTTVLLAAEASAHQVYISFGLCEIDNQTLYNSQVLLDSQGQIVSVHRKMHLTPWDVEDGFQPGSTVTFDMIDGIKTATIICYDCMSADINRQIFQTGAKLVLLSLADQVDETFVHYGPEALSDSAWFVSANRVGNEDGNTYDGHIAISAPSGAIRAKSSKQEDYVYAKVGIW
jgi:predicted amidohydrolase